VAGLSKRVFTHLTAFQYVLWALNWHIGKMLLKSLPLEVATHQLLELEIEEGTVQGKCFDLSTLKSALATFVKHYSLYSYKKHLKELLKIQNVNDAKKQKRVYIREYFTGLS
jgi:hypothetical protein